MPPGDVGPIAYISGLYPRATDTFIQREVHALRRLGLDIHTFSIRKTSGEHLVGDEQRQEQESTFHVLPETIRPVKALFANAAELVRPGRYLKALWLAWNTAPRGIRGRLLHLVYFQEAIIFARELRRLKIVHVHEHMATNSCTVAMIAGALTGVPYSFTIHGPDIFFAPERWRLDEKTGRAAFAVCISEFARSQAMIWSHESHWRKLLVIHCGVDPSRYASAGSSDPNRLLFVGRLAAVKGLPVLFRALAEVLKSRPSMRLKLVGDGPEGPALRIAADSLGIGHAVEFCGYRSQSEVAELLGETGCFVLPSFAEGVPVVLMEAMAARVPVIATNIAGIPELVTHGQSGLLVTPGSWSSLRDAILQLAGDAELRSRLGTAGRERIKQEFCLEDQARKLANVFIEFIRKRELIADQASCESTQPSP